MLAEKGVKLEGVFRQKGSCSLHSGRGAKLWGAMGKGGDHRVKLRCSAGVTLLCCGDLVTPWTENLFLLDGRGRSGEDFSGTEGLGQLSGQWWR